MQKKGNVSESLMGRIRKAESLAGRQRQLPASFADTLTVIMQEKGISHRDLAIELNVSERTIGRLKNEDYVTDKQMVLGLCVALGLTPVEAMALYEKAGFSFRKTSGQDVAYAEILASCGRYSIDDVNDALEACGYGKLGGWRK